MNDLLETRLFTLLGDALQEVTNQEIQNAYGNFMEQVRTVSQSENNHSEIFRTLNITCVELVFLKSLYQHGQGKKCPKICLSPKSIGTCQF
jgi:TnpA family transposase